MIRGLSKAAVFCVMLLGLPMSGVLLGGLPPGRYLEFPPVTLYVHHAPFSRPVFASYCLFVLLVLLPFVKHALSSDLSGKGMKTRKPGRYPWWGWTASLLGVVFWVVAWSRFSWFATFQAHTFTPLWLSYIVTMNGLTFKRRGGCILLERPLSYLLLFPVSALFWWLFEYLNRFVQNWYYIGPPMSPTEYFWYATLAFSTVLPAFTATREWVLTFSWPEKFQQFFPISLPWPKTAAGLILALAGLGLLLLGIYPDYAFSLLWISPLLILVSLRTLYGEPHLFSQVARGRWRILVASSVSALICGCFWEMWNFYSLAKWIYQVPFVQRFHLFEMPLIGYAGYLPFGLECAVIVEMVMRSQRSEVGGQPKGRKTRDFTRRSGRRVSLSIHWPDMPVQKSGLQVFWSLNRISVPRLSLRHSGGGRNPVLEIGLSRNPGSRPSPG